MFTHVLISEQFTLLQQIAKWMTPHGYYLGGGTALAIQLGHRKSIDLDWFATTPIGDAMKAAYEIQSQGIRLENIQIAPGTLYATANQVQMSLLEYRYPLLKLPTLWQDAGCLLAAPEDIACMKLVAVAQRGSKKDFIDVFALLQQFTLTQMLQWYQQKYAHADIAPVLYGLNYFLDAEKEPTPEGWAVNWETVKKTIRTAVLNRPEG